MTHRSTSFVLLAALFALCALLPSVSALFCGRDNCYTRLGLKSNATKLEVRRAYRRLSSSVHPDKHPDDPKAQDTFRKLNAAYEALTDDGKRAKYDDFLENPGKYWQYLHEIYPERYAPKSNTFLVITGIIGVVTLMHWLTMNHNYKETLRRMRETQEFKREIARLLKSKQAATKEEAEGMIHLDVVGLEEPDWRNLIVFKAVHVIPAAAKFGLWSLRWAVMYKLFKRPYADCDKEYVIRNNMGMSAEEWESVSEKEKKTFLEKELWDKEKCDDFMRLKRIELNKQGKLKKKKKHTPQFYSETEDVQMNDMPGGPESF